MESIWSLVVKHADKMHLDTSGFSKNDYICVKCKCKVQHHQMDDRGPNKKIKSFVPVVTETIITKQVLRHNISVLDTVSHTTTESEVIDEESQSLIESVVDTEVDGHFKLMVGNNSGSFKSSKTPGLIRYQAIKNSNNSTPITQLVTRKNPIENIPNGKMKIGPLAGTLKSINKPQHRPPSHIRNVQIQTPASSPTSTIQSRVSFNIIGTSSASNIPQKSASQPYTVKLLSLPQKTTTTMTQTKPQILHQLHSQPRQQQQQQQHQELFVSNGTDVSHRTEIERQIAELKKETQELRKKLELSQKQNDENKKETQELRKKLELSQRESDEYKFRLEKLESEKEQEREKSDSVDSTRIRE